MPNRKGKKAAINAAVSAGVASLVTEWRLLIVLSTVAALLSGCPLSKPPQHAEVVKEALPQGTTIPPTWSSATDTEDVTNGWLLSFDDPGLDAVVKEGHPE